MSGLGYAFAGALAGAGKGIAQVGLEEMEQRRQTALENLRSQNSMVENEFRADLQDRNASRQTERDTDADIKKAGVEEDIRTRQDERRHGYEKELKQIEEDIRTRQDERRHGYEKELKQIDFNNDGSYKRTDVPSPPRGGSSGSGSILEQLGDSGQGGNPGLAPGRQPAPTTPPAQSASNSNAPAKPKSTSAGKTYTMSDAQATAKQYGVTVEQVHRKMREQGFKLAN